MEPVMFELVGTPLVRGAGRGKAATADVAISFWGGLDPATGEVIDRRHPLSGRVVAGCVLVVPHGRGSCSASGVLLEAIRNGTAPAGIVVSRVDPIIGLGAILGEELYGRAVPVVLVSEQERQRLRDGDEVAIGVDGRIAVDRRPS